MTLCDTTWDNIGWLVTNEYKEYISRKFLKPERNVDFVFVVLIVALTANINSLNVFNDKTHTLKQALIRVMFQLMKKVSCSQDKNDVPTMSFLGLGDVLLMLLTICFISQHFSFEPFWMSPVSLEEILSCLDITTD